MEQYKNTDGTYTSPKNGKTYKSLKAFTAHWHYAGTTSTTAFRERLCNKDCQYCNRAVIISNIKKHESACYLNPVNVKVCVICNGPIKDYTHSKGTCSRSCANTHFRSGEGNGNWRDSINSYATLCYRFHEKKCVVCGETDAVDVHHLDSNRENNSIENLIPLCPTHHAYCHRGLFFKIKEKIDIYLTKFKSR